MAESSLDDFFAKKDKSKKKSKSKITPGDILSQQEKELGSKKKKKKNKENESTQSSGSGAEGAPKKEDEEWVDFEQETEKDYTGLRIQNLQINKDKSDQEDEGNDNENDDECDENGERREGAQGPWNVSQGQPSQSQQQQQQPQPQQPVPQAAAATPSAEESKSDTTSAKPGKYVPPSMRAGMGGSASSSDSPGSARPTPRRKKTAPNVNSEEDFPTLGGGPTPAELSELSGSSFNKVQSGGKHVDDPSKAQQSLTLGNKFSALQD